MNTFTPEQFEIMEVEGITEDEVWAGSEIERIKPILEIEVTHEVPGMERAAVCGSPFALAEELDYQQGFDNPYGAFGTCGLTSIANVCVIGGKEVTEPEVVEYAMENNLCAPSGIPGTLGGGTTIGNLIDILSHYGIESHCEFKDTADYTRLAEAIEGGRGVILGLNSGILQDRPWKIYNDAGELNATHAVCLTATVRDCDTGELVGFYMCDSSSQRPDGAKLFVTLEEMDDCYMQTRDGFAVIHCDNGWCYSLLIQIRRKRKEK